MWVLSGTSGKHWLMHINGIPMTFESENVFATCFVSWLVRKYLVSQKFSMGTNAIFFQFHTLGKKQIYVVKSAGLHLGLGENVFKLK